MCAGAGGARGAPTPLGCARRSCRHRHRRERSGLRLIYRADNEVEQELRELAALERECCAFADWSVRSSDGQVVLDIRGESDVAIAAVQEMFLTETVDVGGRSVDTANARHGRQRQRNSALSRQ
jgi:hypothetical protein